MRINCWFNGLELQTRIVWLFQAEEFILHGWELKLKLCSCIQRTFLNPTVPSSSSGHQMLFWNQALSTRAEREGIFVEQKPSVENVSSYYPSYLITMTRPFSIWRWLSFHTLFFYDTFCFPSLYTKQLLFHLPLKAFGASNRHFHLISQAGTQGFCTN